MKVYISGKIGEEVLSDTTREKFAKAERMLRQMGYDVFNPTCSGFGLMAEEKAVLQGTNFYKEILLLDLGALAKCDAIYMLPDWQKSPGAKAERAYAKAIGLEIIRAGKWYDKEYMRKYKREWNRKNKARCSAYARERYKRKCGLFY